MKTPRSGASTAPILVLLGAACYSPYGPLSLEDWEEWRTRSAMAEVREGLAEYREVTGGWPSALDDLCRDTEWCADHPPPGPPHFADAWGTPFSFDPDNGEYELRAAGPDGAFGTGDDIWYRPGFEAERVASLSGCYRVTSGSTKLPGSLLLLDSESLGESSYGAWFPEGDVEDPIWAPLDSADVVISWLVPPARTYRLRLIETADGLNGHLEGAPVSARRTECPS